jgi:cell division protein FtsB
MTIKRGIIIILLLGALVLLWMEITLLWKEKIRLTAQKMNIDAQMASLLRDSDQTQKDIAYYSIPTNLERVAREKLNYVAAGEKLIIVVPHTAE